MLIYVFICLYDFVVVFVGFGVIYLSMYLFIYSGTGPLPPPHCAVLYACREGSRARAPRPEENQGARGSDVGPLSLS